MSRRQAMERARGDVSLNRWVTRAIEERLQAEGYELNLNQELGAVVPIRPGITATLKQPKAKRAEKQRRRARPTGTWRQ